MDSTVRDRRQAIRRQGRERRRALEATDRAAKEQQIAATICQMLGPSWGSVGLYISDDGEPSLAPVAAWLWEHGHSPALPVLDAEPSSTMRFQPWHPDDQLAPGRYGIPGPPQREEVEVPVVLVPLVAFDPSGNRLGRGAGFYDRWLGGRSVAAIGVAFECQWVDEVPSLVHDVPLHAVITELGVRYPFGAQ